MALLKGLQSHHSQQLEESFSNQVKFRLLGPFPTTFKASSLSMLRFSLYSSHIFLLFLEHYQTCSLWHLPFLLCAGMFVVISASLLSPSMDSSASCFLKCLTLDGSGLESTNRASGGSEDSQWFKLLRT